VAELTKKNITIITIILTSLWSIFAVVQTPKFSWSDVQQVSFYIASILGFLGVNFLLWMYVLGTRSFTGLYFKDLAWTMKIHQWLGKYGIALVFLHPLLTAYYYGENMLTYSLPNISTFNERQITYGRLAIYALFLVWLTSAIVRSKIAYRPWKYLHYSAYIVLPLSLVHTKELSRSMDGSQIVLLYYYIAVLVFLVFTALRMRHIFGYGKVQFRVVGQTQVAPNVYLLRLVNKQKSLGVQPGQYVYLQKTLVSEEHPFSVTDYDPQTGELLLGYKVFGKYTQKLTRLEAGNTVHIDGPYGVFTSELKTSQRRPVFIAGGIGVTPFIHHALHASQDDLPWFFYANTSPNAAAFLPHLSNKLQDKLVPVYSDPALKNVPSVETGYVDAQLIQKYMGDTLKEHDFYICGPKMMMRMVRRSLLDAGVRPEQIYTEEFSF
jgi:predicted ferric reductase